MEIQAQSYYAKNAKGEILFKIELSSIEGFPWLGFNCSLDIDLNKYTGLKKTIEILCAPQTPPEKKAASIQKLIKQIKRLEGIEKLYFIDRGRNEEPRLKNGIATLLNHIFSQDDFKEYTPFSETQNTYFFNVLKDKLGGPQHFNDMTEVEKDCYESIIKGHKNLEDEYVNCYSPSATFSILGVRFDDINYEFYFMKTTKIVLIFYIEEL